MTQKAMTAKLAETILSLTYGELMDVGRELEDAIAEKDVWPTFGTAEDFATLLHGWAESQEPP